MDCRIPCDHVALLHDALQSILLISVPQFPHVMVKNTGWQIQRCDNDKSQRKPTLGTRFHARSCSSHKIPIPHELLCPGAGPPPPLLAVLWRKHSARLQHAAQLQPLSPNRPDCTAECEELPYPAGAAGVGQSASLPRLAGRHFRHRLSLLQLRFFWQVSVF